MMGTSLGVLLFPRPNPFSLMSLIHFVASTSTISHHAQLERQPVVWRSRKDW